MDFQPLIDAIRAARTPVFFTGAGVSTLCGIPDFRGPDGIYRDRDAARMFDIDLFDEDPSFFYRHADRLVYGNDETKPGPVHEALVALQKAGRSAGVITQNIDGLHERAGSSPVFAVHGTAALHHCRKCGGVYKPDITFFGEMLPEAAFEGAIRLASRADLIVVLGSSLTVQPAAFIPHHTLRNGGRMAIVNRGETPSDGLAFFRADDLAEFARQMLATFA